ncbi:hypothetical protein DAI22_04g257200 [Oryza sativa Japonica Group]|nr:hypothetical protein DAI22_04g257200 [Oryza sativa Japonica Group]
MLSRGTSINSKPFTWIHGLFLLEYFLVLCNVKNSRFNPSYVLWMWSVKHLYCVASCFSSEPVTISLRF